MCINIIVKRGIRGLQKQKNIRLKNRNGGITMRQRNEDGYLEVLSMEEYLEKRQALTAQQKRTKKLRPEKMTEDTVIELAQLMYM